MIPIPAQADVVVIGGGPAGSTAANILARAGYVVVLLDKAQHPRNTVGESVLPHIWHYLDQLDATADVERAGFIYKSGGTTQWSGVLRQMSMKDFGFKRPGLHVERDRFDDILLRAAQRRGAQVFEKVSVRAVTLEENPRRVTYVDRRAGSAREGSIGCNYVIDASGQAAVIASQLGFREFDQDLRFTSVWGYYDNASYVAQGGHVCPWELRREIRPTTTQIGRGDWGWCWHITQQDRTSVGLVFTTRQAAAFKTDAGPLDARFDRACRLTPIIGELLQPATVIPGSVLAIRDFAYRPVRLAGAGWFVTGDAAAFVDPINSAGVVTACYTGLAAAHAVDGCLRRPSHAARFEELYSTLVRQRLALFRVSAIPAGHNSYPDDLSDALAVARLDSASEQELLLVQTFLTDRRSNLSPLYAMDKSLRFEDSTRYRQLDRLIRYDSTTQLAS